MTKRDIIKTLLNKQLPDRVGLKESFWPFIVENAWQAQGIAPDTDFVKRFNLDLRGIFSFSAPAPRPDLACVVEESDEWIVKRDGWGASLKTWKHKAGTPEHVGFSLGKLNGMKALRAPYVFLSDHSIPPTVTVSDYEFMLELFWKNCRY